MGSGSLASNSQYDAELRVSLRGALVLPWHPVTTLALAGSARVVPEAERSGRAGEPKQSLNYRGLLTALPKEHTALAYGASVMRIAGRSLIK